MNALKSVWRVFKELGVVGYSRKKNILGMNPLFVSTIFMLLTAVLAKLARKVVNSTVDGFIKQLLLEFIATAELCASCFELIIVADNYGVWMYALYLFLLTVSWVRTWENASACPYTPMEEILEGRMKLQDAVCIILAQLLGGVVIFKYVQSLWALELVETHKGRAEEDCSADLQVRKDCELTLWHRRCAFRVNPIVGFLLELTVSFVHRAFIHFCGGRQFVLATLLRTSCTVVAVNLALPFTFTFLNPVVTTAMKWRCRELGGMTHLLVYWVANCTGALCAFKLYKTRELKHQIILPQNTVKNRSRGRKVRVGQEYYGPYVPMVIGAVVEGVATCICRLASRFLSDSGARYAPIVDSFFATMMVVAAFNFSGGYFNPALATSLKFGCDGQTFGEFMVVYWLGACIGSLLSVVIYNSNAVQNMITRIKEKQE